jgi:hypothetical protein
MAITAKSRAQLALQATTILETSQALAIVKQASERAKGGGISLLTSGVANVGAQVHVEKEGPDGLSLSITSGKRVVELCVFSAEVHDDGERTHLRVGGLERYKSSQQKVLGFIPAGPKMILGYDLYRRFLQEVGAGLKAADEAASVSIAVPAPAGAAA